MGGMLRVVFGGMLLLLMASCQLGPSHPGPVMGSNPYWEPQPYQPTDAELETVKEPTDKELLSQIKAVAVLPFLDQTSGRDHTLGTEDLEGAGEALANHLTGGEVFSTILYPSQVAILLAGEVFDIQDQGDLKEMANKLDVDAIVFGVIRHYRMYQPAELSLSMKFYLTRMDRFAISQEISRLAHVGIPLHSYNPTFFKQLWDTSAYYNASSSEVRRKLDTYKTRHDMSGFGFDDARVYQSKKDFLNFIAFDLACSLFDSKSEERRSAPAGMFRGQKKKVHVKTGYFGK